MTEWKVTQTDAPRLDAFLLARLPAQGIGRLHKYLRQNKIKVNGKKMPLSARLAAGDVVRVYLPAQEESAPPLACVYEDDAVLIVNKPAGVPSLDEADAQTDTLIARALHYLREKGEVQDSFTPCLCHRLDTGTSGLVMIAKTEAAYRLLTEAIAAHKLEKRYVCVTFGQPAPKAATLTGWLCKDARRGVVQIYDAPVRGARKVVTQYETLAVSGRLALLGVTLVTGRTHQIRAHLASIGCPVLGDSKYGDNAANRAYRCKYQALCAYELRFPAMEGACAALSGKTIRCEKPWYYTQILDGTLF